MRGLEREYGLQVQQAYRFAAHERPRPCCNTGKGSDNRFVGTLRHQRTIQISHHGRANGFGGRLALNDCLPPLSSENEINSFVTAGRGQGDSKAIR